MSSKLRIIGYGRESTKEQARYGFNLDDQEKKIHSYVDLYYEPGKYQLNVIREEGASAKSLDRPRMNEIIAAVKRRQVDVIVVHNLDRLTRRVKDLATLLELFDEYHVQLRSITENIDTNSPMGRFFVFLIVLIAQWEQDTISDRTRRGIEESARQGNYALPGAPFGYRRDPDDNHKLIIHEEEAAVVRRIFESIANKEYSIRSLRNDLNGEKAAGRSWNETMISKILDNKIYYGTFSRFGEEYENHTVPIIDKELYELAHDRLEGKKPIQLREYVYNGIVRCAKCGNPMINHSSKSCTGRIYSYYRCKKCKTQVSENAINTLCGEKLTQRLQDKQYMSDLVRVKEQYEELADILDSIPLDALRYDTDISYLAGLYSRKKDEKVKLDYCLHTLAAGLQHSSFMSLPYTKKRDFLKGNVEHIIYDNKSKTIDIQYLNNRPE